VSFSFVTHKAYKLPIKIHQVLKFATLIGFSAKTLWHMFVNMFIIIN